MRDARHLAHQTQGATQKLQQMGGIALPLIGVVVAAVLFAMLVPTGGKAPVPSQAQAIADRIQPVGTVELQAATGGGARSGEDVYKAVCAGCHAAGALGAPKTGDAGAWGPRLGTGFEALLRSALNGKNSMPAKGGAADLSELEVARAVVYIANQSGGKFAEPKAPAGAASAAQ